MTRKTHTATKSPLGVTTRPAQGATTLPGSVAFAGFRLESMPLCSAEAALAQSARLLDSIWQLSENASYEMRWIGGGGRVDCLLLVRAFGLDRAAAIGEVRRVIHGVRRIITLSVPTWRLSALETAAHVKRALHPFSVHDGGDVRRRDLLVGTEGEDEAVRVASLLLPADAEMDLLLRLLATSPDPVLLSMVAEPYTLDCISRAALHSRLRRAEDGVLDPYGATDVSTFDHDDREGAPVILMNFAARTLGMRLAQPERTARLRVSLASSAKLDRAVVSAACGAFGAGSGNARFTPAADADCETLRRNVENLGFEPWGAEQDEAVPGECYLAVMPEVQTSLRLPPALGSVLRARVLDPAPRHAPVDIARVGTPLGVSASGRPVALAEAERSRHLYVVGQTGTGKSTLLLNALLHDVELGKGICLIDPHGDLADDFLARMPESRAEDVVLIDVTDDERPVGLNLFDVASDAERDLVIQDIIGILYRLYDPGHTGIIGPRFEHWLRSAAITLMTGPVPGTFLDVPRLFLDDGYLARRLQHVHDPYVRMFWINELGQTSDYHKSEMLGWFVSKWGAFASNGMMRRVLGQTATTVRVGDIMEEGKILIARLPKGGTGEINMALLGMILLNKVQMAAMRRAEIPAEERRPFALYVDEFQNFVMSSFESLIAEGRKYGLELVLAHQHVEQCPARIREAVLGNVSSRLLFRLGLADAKLFESDAPGEASAHDLTHLENYRCIAQVTQDGRPVRPFDVFTHAAPAPHPDVDYACWIRRLSATRYGTDAALIDAQVAARFERRPLPGKS